MLQGAHHLLGPWYTNTSSNEVFAPNDDDPFHSKKLEGMLGWSKLDVALIDSGDRSHHPYTNQFNAFAEALDKGVDPHNSLESAVDTHKVIFACDRSAAEGRIVKLSELG